MAFNGSGVFLRLRSWIADATAGVKIRADFHDDEDNNFADGLSHCIVKDGQTTITQNIPWNSKRITALADPVDAQDAATKAYADTKAPLAGDVPFTGDVTIKNDDPSLTLDGKPGFINAIYGDKNSKHRWALVLGNQTAESGSDAGSDFELVNYHDDGSVIGDVLFGSRATGLLTVKADPTAALGISTKQYTDTTATTAANAAAATRLPLAGGTITGNLAVNGSLTAPAFICSGNTNVSLTGNATNGVLSLSSLASITYDPGSNIVVFIQIAGSIVGAWSSIRDYTINGAAWKPGGGMWASSSDARIKTVNGDYTQGLAAIRQLMPRRYTYNGTDVTPTSAPAKAGDVDPPKGKPNPRSSYYAVATEGKEFIGLIAQEAEGAMPEMVSQINAVIDGEPVTDFRLLDTTPLIFALVNAVKELSDQITALEARTGG